MNTHWQNVQLLVDLGRILDKDGFDYIDDPLVNEYELFFRFGQEELNTSFEKGEIAVSYFYYINSDSFNGMAHTPDVLNSVGIFKGLFRQLYDLLLARPEICDDEDAAVFKQEFHLTRQRFLFDFTLRFTFYHEKAHLMHSPYNQEVDIFGINSKMVEVSWEASYNEESHAREYDADYYAAGQMAEYCLNLFNTASDKSPATAQLLLETAAAGFACYFTILMRGHEKMYTAQGTHPHPVVRYVYCMEIFLSKLSEAWYPAVDLSAMQKMAEAVARCFISLDFAGEAGKFYDLVREAQDQIQLYIQTLKVIAKRYSLLIINKPQ